MAYTSECFPCRPGTFSKTPGSSSCDLCPRNTYSGKGASSCTHCTESQYSRMNSQKILSKYLSCSFTKTILGAHVNNVSLPTHVCVLEEGWSTCKERPPCSEKDYFQIHTACDSEGKVGNNAECVLF